VAIHIQPLWGWYFTTGFTKAIISRSELLHFTFIQPLWGWYFTTGFTKAIISRSELLHFTFKPFGVAIIPQVLLKLLSGIIIYRFDTNQYKAQKRR
jgi:hypothetical protein